MAIMSDKQMLDESVNSSVPLAAQFSIFVNGNVPGKADPPCLEECCGGVSFESVKFFASNFRCHEGRNCITRVELTNSTSVLRRVVLAPNAASVVSRMPIWRRAPSSDGIQEIQEEPRVR